jgi:hypothetical protein
MKKLLICLLLVSTAASANELDNVVLDVAASKMSMNTTTLSGKHAEVVYVGKIKNVVSGTQCDAVSIRWTHERIENFRVCNGEVRARNTVSPAWDEKVGRPTFVSVVNNSILYGQAKQTDRNGYLVSARALNAISDDCKNIEVIVSYDGDLVDHDVHKVCDKLQ